MKDSKALERADIIVALRCCGNTDTKRPDCEHCPLNGYMCVKRMLEGAADLLKRDAEPPNDPLTLGELRGMDGEPVWVEFVGKPDGSPIPPLWMLVDVRSKQLVTGTEFVDWREESWLAYRRKPDGGGE